jgi:hypothetical protein
MDEIRGELHDIRPVRARRAQRGVDVAKDLAGLGLEITVATSSPLASTATIPAMNSSSLALTRAT